MRPPSPDNHSRLATKRAAPQAHIHIEHWFFGSKVVEAAKLAGYPQGSQFAASARKRARRKDVKALVAELQNPAKEKLAETIKATFEWATKQLFEVGNLPIGICKVRASDKIRAIEVLAKLHGWYAPEKTDLREDLKIERIECVIVEPQNRDGGSVPPAAGAYDQLASHNR